MSCEMVHGHGVGEWVAQQMGAIFSSASASAIGLHRNGILVAGIIYEDWNGASVCCHIAFKGRVTAAFLFTISDYAFHQLGVRKIIAPCYADNVRAMRILPKMGFIEEGRLKDAQPHGDIALFTMTQEQCKYLGERYEKRPIKEGLLAKV